MSCCWSVYRVLIAIIVMGLLCTVAVSTVLLYFNNFVIETMCMFSN